MFRNRLPSIFSQSGFAPVILLVLVMFGIAAGTILVQNGVNFIPKAADEQEALKPVDPKKLKECDDKEKPEDVQKCKDQVCADDEVTYCDNRGDKPKAIRKTGGYYDPQHPLHDGSGCVFDFFEVSEKNDQCSKSESKNGDVVYTTKGEGDQIDSRRKNSQKDREKADKCASKVECRKNGDKLEAWRIISTYDEETNKCIGAKIENGRLVSDSTVEKFEFNDAGRDADCKSKKDKDVIEQSNSDGPKDSKDLASSSDRGRFGVDTDNQTKTLLSNFESTRARIQSNSVLNAEQKKKLLDKIDKADKALQNAKSYIDKCIQTGTQTDCSAALSAQIYAVALSREALAEVVEAGIEGTKENPIRVKTDLQIGQNNNSQVTAKPANGVPGFGRVFARAEGGKIYFEVRGDDGKFYLADPADLKSAGLTQGMSLEDYQKWLSGRLEAVRQTTKTEPVLTPAGAASANKCETQGTVMRTVDGKGQIGCDVLVNAPIDLNKSYCRGLTTGKQITSLKPDLQGRQNYYYNKLVDLDPKEEVQVVVFFQSKPNEAFTCTPNLNKQASAPAGPQARQSNCGFPELAQPASQETCPSGLVLTYCLNGGGFRCYPNGADPVTYKPATQNKPTDLKSLIIDPNNKNCNQGCTFKYPNTASSYRQNEGAITVSIGQGVADGYRLTSVCRIKKDGSQVCLDTRNRLAGRFTPGIETPAGETITITTPAELDAFIKSKISAYAEFVEKVFSE